MIDYLHSKLSMLRKIRIQDRHIIELKDKIKQLESEIREKDKHIMKLQHERDI